MNKAELITELEGFVTLQTSLVESFCSSYPQVTDLETLVDSPRNGPLTVGRTTWFFQKHGIGLTFENPEGVVVNAHSSFHSPRKFDAWRILLYLNSIGKIDEDSLENDIEIELSKLVSSGDILQEPKGLYTLA